MVVEKIDCKFSNNGQAKFGICTMTATLPDIVCDCARH